MHQSIAHDKVRSLDNTVIPRDLIEHLLRNRHIRPLVFHHTQRLQLPCVYQRISPTRRAVQRKRHLIAHQCRRKTSMRNEKRHKILPHPFFGSQGNPLTPESVIDFHAATPRIAIRTNRSFYKRKI